ncbi:MAG: RbsD/FucU family protein, partial [Acutalibacteraceae bacterium]
MLKNISKLISPELLKVLCEMGHGDEIVIADGNFPAASNANILIRADGISTCDMLDAVLQLFPLDQYDENNFVLMQKCPGDNADTSIWDSYKTILKKYEANTFIT